ncbi:MAG: DUF3853 family protein [Bacteroidota bacterium]
MGKIIVVDEDDLRRIIREILSENKAISHDSISENRTEQDELFTSLEDIAGLFNCSLPTAQKIKNSIPKDSYRQCGKTFGIRKSILLNTNEELNKYKYNKNN